MDSYDYDRQLLPDNDGFGPLLSTGQCPRYWIYRSLGRGGQGEVYAAWDWKMSRFVALKFVNSDWSHEPQSGAKPSTGLRTLGQEARQAGEASNSQHVIALHEFADHDPKLPYLVMQYAAGGRLSALKREECRGSAKAVRNLVRWLQQVADGLTPLHQKGNIHGDIKPENILLVLADPRIPAGIGSAAPALPEAGSFQGSDLDAKLADFGLSGPAGRSGLGIGTPGYMPPDPDEPRTAYSDVYALGVTACEMLTDCISKPAQGKAPRSLPSKEELARLPCVGKDLAAVVAKAIAIKPPDRYPTAEEMGQDLNRVLLDEQVKAREAGLQETLARWRRKNPARALLSAVAASLLVLLAVGGVLLWVVANERLAAQSANARLLQDASVNEARFGDIGYGILLAGHSLRIAPRQDKTQADAVRHWISLMEPQVAPLRFVHHLDGELRSAVNYERMLAIVGTSKGVISYVDLKTPGLVIDPETAKPKQITIGKDIKQTGVSSLSFRRDGRRFAVSTVGKQIHVYDTDAGNEVLSFFHPNRPMSVAYSPDGSVLTVASHGTKKQIPESQLISYSAETGKKLVEYPVFDDLYMVDYSPDGKQIACCGEVEPSPRVSLFNLLDPKTQPVVLQHPTRVFTVTYSPDGKTLATGGVDGVIRFWNVQKQEENHPSIPLNKQARLLAFSPDGRYFLAGSEDRTARIWDLNMNKPIGQVLYHLGDLRCGGISSGIGRVFTADLNGDVRIWDMPPSSQEVRVLKHPGPVWDAEFSPDGKRVITGCLNGPTESGAGRVWDLATGKVKLLAHGADTQVVRFRPGDPNTAVTAGNNKLVKFWDATTGREKYPSLAHHSIILHGEFSPTGRFFVFGGRANSADQFGAWDFDSNRELKVSLPAGSKHPVASLFWNMTFSQDGRLLIDGGTEARIWRVDEGRLLSTIWHTAQPASSEPDNRHDTCGVISRDGKWAAVYARQTNSVVIWDLSQQPPHQTKIEWPHPGQITALVFHPTRPLLATAAEGTVRLWSIDKPHEKAKELRHESAVETIAFSPDGQLLATGTRYGLVRTWSAETGNWTGGLWIHSGLVGKVAFSGDSNRIVSASRDKTAQICTVPADRTAKSIERLLTKLESMTGIAVTISTEGTSASFSPPRPLSAQEWLERQ